MATVLVGPDGTKFVIHQTLLCDRSKYFAKALTGSFEEGTTGIVRLEDVSPILFKIVVSWLYYGKLFYTISDDVSTIEQAFASFKYEEDVDKMKADDTATWPKQVLIELYVLADRLDIKELRVNTIDALITSMNRSKTTLEGESYTFIDLNTTVESPLWKFVVNRLAYHMRHSMVERKFWLDLPHEMAITALLLNAQRVPRTLCGSCYLRGIIRNDVKLAADHPCKNEDKMSSMVDDCIYHEHADDAEKKLCRASRNKNINK